MKASDELLVKESVMEMIDRAESLYGLRESVERMSGKNGMVKDGKWKDSGISAYPVTKGNIYVCSKCGIESFTNSLKYCPSCGARMV